jgi:hypothetical protein
MSRACGGRAGARRRLAVVTRDVTMLLDMGILPRTRCPSDVAKQSEATERGSNHMLTEDVRENHNTEILVNGRPRKVAGNVVSFEQVVEIAFPDDPPNPDRIYTVAYRHGAKKSEGTLVAGQFVEVKNGTQFDVVKSNKS